MRNIACYRLAPIALVFPIVLALAGPSLAQPSADVPPSTLTLDRMDAATRLGIQVGFDKLNHVNLSDGFVMRFEPYGQYVFPNHGVGIYGHLPIAHVFDFNGSDVTGVGNLDVGAFFLPLHNSALILRAGVALASASTAMNETFANIASTYERMTDFLLIAPNYTTLRFSASTVQESEVAFFRGDFGFDLAIDKPSNGRGVFVRGNLAAGVRLPAVDLAAELVNIGYLDGSGDISKRFMHTLAGGFRTRGPHQFYAGMVFPLDQAARGEIWIVSLGYQFATM
jgi:hypothetical protein